MSNNTSTTPPTLLGQYTPPQIKQGDWLFCELRGKVQVGGYTDAPIPWPRLKKSGRHVHIICNDLVKAIKTESAQAIAHWFGVHPHTVTKWRRALGVSRNTPGSRKLHQELFDKRIPNEAKKRGLQRMHSPDARAKSKASKQGKDVHSNSLDALTKARRQPKSKAWKKKHSELMRQQWAEGKRSHPTAWTSEEIDLLSKDTDKAISDQIGRTINAVAVKRRSLKIKPFKA